MSENNYGAMMLKSSLSTGDDIESIVDAGIYSVPSGNATSPDSSGGTLIISASSPKQRVFISNTFIMAVSLMGGNSVWGAWSRLGEAAKRGVATDADMQTGTSTALLTTVAAVMSLFPNKTYSTSDYIRIPDRPGGLIIQWRQNITDGLSTGKLHNFPTPFPAQLLFVVPIDLTTSSSTAIAACAVDYSESTGSAAKIFVTPGNPVFSMLAIGR